MRGLTMRRVVITGMGIISSLGNTITAITRALQEGRSGVELVLERKQMGFRSSLAGTLKNFEIPDIPKKYIRQMGQGSYLAVQAVQQALNDAELRDSDIQSERAGIIIGNSGNMKDTFEQCDSFINRTRRLGGTALQRVMASTVSANLSVLLGTRGHCMTVSSACASGASAIGQAYQFVQYGLQDLIICGGVQEGSWPYHCNFDALRVFSKREDEPTKASRPFDKYRDGLVPSVGCGMVVLEEYEHAFSRGARVYAELIGYGTNSDGYDMTMPSGVGSTKCMGLALKDAGIDADKVDYINAHATSTPLGDAVEAQAIAGLFGHRPYVSSTKSMTGHEIGAAGSNELIYTLLMMNNNFIAPNINIEEIDQSCQGISIVANEAIDADIRIALSNSFGFGGVNTCLVVKRNP
jgi:3-oxoacyl-[acyl-carrier-protein] synthase-1